MGDRTSIEWTEATWNPVTGCTKVSAGCDHCYAETIAHRFAGTKAYPNGFTSTLRAERLDQPLRWTRPRRIFVCSMADLFHDDVPEEYIAQVFAVMALAPQHTFQVLTKRHGRMHALLTSEQFTDLVADAVLEGRADGLVWAPLELRERWWPLRNVWLGVSTENQQWADIRIPALLDTPAAVRWISAEPLLGPIDLGPWALRPYERQQGGYWDYATATDVYGNGKSWVPAPPAELDWVVVGGESGRGARPMHPEWARSIRDQCAAAGVPFLFKQWGEWAPRPTPGTALGDVCMSEDRDTYVVDRDYVCAHNESEGEWLRRVGKKVAGRELDGELHDGYPAEAPA